MSTSEPTPGPPSGIPSGVPAEVPYGSAAPLAPVVRPVGVAVAFWLWIGAAVTSLVGVAVAAASFESVKQAAIAEVEAQGNTDVLPDGSIETILLASFGVGIALSVISALLYVLFAVFVFRGMGWARWVMVGFAAIGLLGIVSAYGIGAIQFALLAAGVVLVFLAPARAYFAAAAALRAARRGALS